MAPFDEAAFSALGSGLISEASVRAEAEAVLALLHPTQLSRLHPLVVSVAFSGDDASWSYEVTDRVRALGCLSMDLDYHVDALVGREPGLVRIRSFTRASAELLIYTELTVRVADGGSRVREDMRFGISGCTRLLRAYIVSEAARAHATLLENLKAAAEGGAAKP